MSSRLFSLHLFQVPVLFPFSQLHEVVLLAVIRLDRVKSIRMKLIFPHLKVLVGRTVDFAVSSMAIPACYIDFELPESARGLATLPVRLIDCKNVQNCQLQTRNDASQPRTEQPAAEGV